ncbi:MAG: type II secretion system minor pseudopilin GspK, partial [Pseudomonadota bacterium]
QRGVALITAVLIVAMATVIGTQIIWLDQLQMRRGANLIAMDQAVQYALGGEAWAADILRTDREESEIDFPGEVWALDIAPIPVPGGQIEGSLEDLQGRFNINNLITPTGEVNPVQLAVFERMLVELELDPLLAVRVADWLDLDAEPGFPDGAEDDVYTSQTPGYRPPNGPVTSTSELLSILGMEKAAFDLLNPHLTALPVGSAVNINTATPLVLTALSDDITLLEAEGIVQARLEQPFEGIDEFSGRVDAQLALSDRTRYFRSTARVTLGTVQVTMYSLLERDDTGGVATRLRTFGSQ